MSLFLSAVAGQGGVKVPGAPGTLSLEAGSPTSTVIDLSWSAPSDTGGGTISGYRIKMDGSVIVADTGSTGTTYSKTGLTRATSYNFTVAAINEKGTGADGNTPSLTTAATVPGAPGTLSLSAGSPDTSVISLSWSAPSDTGGAAITGYRIKKDGSVLVADTSSTGTTYSATGLTANTAYSFTIAAINSVGTGADGNTPSRSTADAFISASGGTETTYGSYKSHTFTSNGTFTVSANLASKTVDILLVGGGGGGGRKHTVFAGAGGGGGAGAHRAASGQTASVASHSIVVGAGGAYYSAGSASTGLGLTADGGGKGHHYNHSTNSGNGSGGGGGGYAFWPEYKGKDGGSSGAYGNDGGDGAPHPGGTAYMYVAAGGGGGAGSAGSDAQANVGSDTNCNIAGVGGNGTTNSWRTGSNETRAAGGGGGAENAYPDHNGCDTDMDTCRTNGCGGSSSMGGDGSGHQPSTPTANTGSGGGGVVQTYVTSGYTQTGADGVVIIRYATS